MRLAIRGYKKREKVFEEFVDAGQVDLERLALEHALRLVGEAHMIEIEFLDEPDESQRYFRFGTDPEGMVMPIGVRLDGKKN
jgi:hypothetical protein